VDIGGWVWRGVQLLVAKGDDVRCTGGIYRPGPGNAGIEEELAREDMDGEVSGGARRDGGEVCRSGRRVEEAGKEDVVD